MDKTLDLDELERVARAAGDAEWEVVDYEGGSLVIHADRENRVCFMATPGDSPGQMARIEARAVHIATFDPPTILTLIAAARPAVVSDEVVEAMCRAHSASHRQSDDWDRFGPRTQAEHKVAMRAALALLPGGVPDGYMLVPREPTEAMIRSGQGAADDKYWLWRGLGERPVGSGLDGMALYVDAAYRAMLSASPKGSSQSQPSRTAQEPPSPTPCDLEGK